MVVILSVLLALLSSIHIGLLVLLARHATLRYEFAKIFRPHSCHPPRPSSSELSKDHYVQQAHHLIHPSELNYNSGMQSPCSPQTFSTYQLVSSHLSINPQLVNQSLVTIPHLIQSPSAPAVMVPRIVRPSTGTTLRPSTANTIKTYLNEYKVSYPESHKVSEPLSPTSLSQAVHETLVPNGLPLDSQWYPEQLEACPRPRSDAKSSIYDLLPCPATPSIRSQPAHFNASDLSIDLEKSGSNPNDMHPDESMTRTNSYTSCHASIDSGSVHATPARHYSETSDILVDLKDSTAGPALDMDDNISMESDEFYRRRCRRHRTSSVPHVARPDTASTLTPDRWA